MIRLSLLYEEFLITLIVSQGSKGSGSILLVARYNSHSAKSHYVRTCFTYIYNSIQLYIFIKKKKKAKQKSFKEIRAILLHFLRLGSKLHIIWYQKFSDRHISEIEFLGTSVKNCFEVFSLLSHLMISLSSAVPSVCSILKNHQIWPKNMIKILKEKLCSI